MIWSNSSSASSFSLGGKLLINSTTRGNIVLTAASANSIPLSRRVLTFRASTKVGRAEYGTATALSMLALLT